MYEETASACFDPNPTADAIATADNSVFSQSPAFSGGQQLPPPLVVAGSSTNSHSSFSDGLRLSMEELSAFHHHHSPQDDASAAATAAAEIQFPNAADQIDNQNNAHLIHQMMIQDPSSSFGQSFWNNHETCIPQSFNDDHHQQQHHLDLQNCGYNINPNPKANPNPPTPDLLSLLHLPRSIPFTASSSLSDIIASSSCVTFDPLFHLNLPPQPPLIRDLYTPLISNTTMGPFFGMDDNANHNLSHKDSNGAVNEFDKSILEFTKDISGCMRKGSRGSRKNKHFATERERRSHWNDRYDALKDLLPNNTKTDRASILQDAIDYIKELLRRVNELRFLVEKKRCGKSYRNKRQKTEDANTEIAENKPEVDVEQSFSSSNNNNNSNNIDNCLRSSWLQRKSKVAEVDVRIIDDEVTIKIVQKKKINCLLFVSKALDQLQLDLHHVAGGQIGEHYSFLFNAKIYEGSTIYASAIASILIEVVDKQFMVALPTSN